MIMWAQHEAGKRAYDGALEKIQETKQKIKEKEADLVRFTTEFATCETKLKTAKEQEQVHNWVFIWIVDCWKDVQPVLWGILQVNIHEYSYTFLKL